TEQMQNTNISLTSTCVATNSVQVPTLTLNSRKLPSQLTLSSSASDGSISNYTISPTETGLDFSPSSEKSVKSKFQMCHPFNNKTVTAINQKQQQKTKHLALKFAPAQMDENASINN